jgi:hypothetical protein
VPATTQAPPRQNPPPQQPPPAQPPPPAPLIAAVIAALATAVTVAGITAALGAKLLAEGIGHLALAAVAWLMLSWPQDVMEGTGPATHHMVRTNTLRRATFFLNACKRVQAAVIAARSKDEPVRPAIAAAIMIEKRYQAQQVAMAHQRLKAASAIDGLASTYGDLLGWNTVKDSRTTAECYAADRKNFRADRPPIIGFPGATHPNCRCYPSRPFRDAAVLP